MPYHNGMRCDECGAMVGALTFTPLAVNADGAIEVPCPKCGHKVLIPVPEESGWLILSTQKPSVQVIDLPAGLFEVRGKVYTTPESPY